MKPLNESVIGQELKKAWARVKELEADVERRARTLELRNTQVMTLQSRIKAYETHVERLEAEVTDLTAYCGELGAHL